jgi:transposase-like protein
MEISELLDQGITDSEGIGRLGRLGAQLVLQKGIEDEVAAFLQRVRYERTMQARGSRNGSRSKRVMTAEGELEIEMPQLRNTAEKFISRVIPDTRMAIRTRPLEALIIGA